MDDASATEATLRGLRALGVRLAIDDFGTGYSSLAYLQRFSVDTLKIDRAFVTPLDHDDQARTIVRAVTALGHALGIEVTAEGIETPGHWARLLALGCDYGQGSYFARPLSSEAMGALLATGLLSACPELTLVQQDRAGPEPSRPARLPRVLPTTLVGQRTGGRVAG